MFHFPTPPDADVQVFTGLQASGGFAVWNKPAGRTMMCIQAIGGGGGGGGGGAVFSVGARGGGGGGSGTITSLIVPLALVPDMLYVRAGSVAAGGARSIVNDTNGADGTAGVPAHVFLSAQSAAQAQNVLVEARAGGQGLATNVAGGGGVANAVTTAVAAQWAAVFTSIAGNGGTAGGSTSGTAGTSTAAMGTASTIMGGTGGGGADSFGAAGAGGSLDGVANTLIRTSTAWSGGFRWRENMVSYGGCGATGNVAGGIVTGGSPDASAPGAGGGGGAGGLLAGDYNSAGGNGGPGCVTIVCW